MCGPDGAASGADKEAQEKWAAAVVKYAIKFARSIVLDAIDEYDLPSFKQGDNALAFFKRHARTVFLDYIREPDPAELQLILTQAERVAGVPVPSSIPLSRQHGHQAGMAESKEADLVSHTAAAGQMSTGTAAQWTIRLSHNCESQGCHDAQCQLCKHNPYKVCKEQLGNKYLVGDFLTAKCGAQVTVSFHRPDGMVTLNGLPTNIMLQMFLVNGSIKGLEDCTTTASIPDEACILANNKAAPLLTGPAGSTHDPELRVLWPVAQTPEQLPQLLITDSSEAMLPGRKTTFRLVIAAVEADTGQPMLDVKPYVSPAFVVATRRIKGAIKEDYPTVDDPVGKLEHIGRQTEEKLKDLQGAARNCGQDLMIAMVHQSWKGPDGKVSISTVGQFRQLLRDAENDTCLRKQLQQILKMNQDQWHRAYEHAMRAVEVDNNVRIWVAPEDSALNRQNGSANKYGILFSCKRGKVDMQRPIGTVRVTPAGATGEVQLLDNLPVQMRDMVLELVQAAGQAWTEEGHPGWHLAEVDIDTLLLTRTLAKRAGPAAGAPIDGGLHPSPCLPHGPGAGAGNGERKRFEGTLLGMQSLTGPFGYGIRHMMPSPFEESEAVAAPQQAPDMPLYQNTSLTRHLANMLSGGRPQPTSLPMGVVGATGPSDGAPAPAGSLDSLLGSQFTNFLATLGIQTSGTGPSCPVGPTGPSGPHNPILSMDALPALMESLKHHPTAHRAPTHNELLAGLAATLGDMEQANKRRRVEHTKTNLAHWDMRVAAGQAVTPAKAVPQSPPLTTEAVLPTAPTWIPKLPSGRLVQEHVFQEGKLSSPAEGSGENGITKVEPIGPMICSSEALAPESGKGPLQVGSSDTEETQRLMSPFAVPRVGAADESVARGEDNENEKTMLADSIAALQALSQQPTPLQQV